MNVNTSSGHYNEQLQDLNYYYDASGNITCISDAAQQTVFFNNAAVSPDADYTYDALYRLIRAEGRESITPVDFTGDNSSDSHAFVSNVVPWDGSVNALRRYTQKCRYDAVGKILSLQHLAGSGSYTRSYTYAVTSNRLSTTVTGSRGRRLGERRLVERRASRTKSIPDAFKLTTM